MILVLLLVLLVIMLPIVAGMLRFLAAIALLIVGAFLGLQGAIALMQMYHRMMLLAHATAQYASNHRFEAALAGVLALAVLSAAVAAAVALYRITRKAIRNFTDRSLPVMRMRRAVSKLRRARRPLTAQSLARAAGVDHESAMQYVTRNYKSAMPTF